MKMNNEKLEDKTIVFFDGFCNLCSGSVSFILKYEKEEYLYFASLQSDFVKKNFPELDSDQKDTESVVLYENGTVYKYSDAALRISRYLKFPLNYLYFFRFIPRIIRDKIYKLIARYRYRIFGKRFFLYYPETDNSKRFFK
jgi:predicted DCC family thiol-disulfide oxidoreductase YuxK